MLIGKFLRDKSVYLLIETLQWDTTVELTEYTSLSRCSGSATRGQCLWVRVL